jgi:hypothetical protein
VTGAADRGRAAVEAVPWAAGSPAAEPDTHPLHQAPVTAPVGRLDEARAARTLVIR